MLDNAFQTLADAGCETVTVRDIPETVDGVHLFRNGFAEAARARGLVLRQVPFGGDCEFAWTSGGFVRVTRER